MKLATAQQLKQSLSKTRNEISTGNCDTQKEIKETKEAECKQPARFSTVSDFLSVKARSEISKTATNSLWLGYEWLRNNQCVRCTKCTRCINSKSRFIVRDELFYRYKQQVEAVGKRIFRKVPSRSLISEGDVINCALHAHIEGIEKYSVKFGTTYMQYLNAPNGRSRIYGRCVDYMRKCQHLPRRIAGDRRELDPKIEALMHKLGKINVSVEDITDHYGDDAGHIMADPLFGASVYNQELTSDSGEDESSYSQFDDVFNGGAKLLSGNSGNDRNGCSGEKCSCNGSSGGSESGSNSRELTDRCKYEGESKILSLIDDEDIRFVIWSYTYLGMVSSEIADVLGKSISTVALLKERGYKILRTKMTKEEMKDICHLVRYGD